MKDGRSEVYRGRPKLGNPSETVTTSAKTLIKMAAGEFTIAMVSKTLNSLAEMSSQFKNPHVDL